MNIVVDFAKEQERIKPMHCVNNGPVGSGGVTSNFEAYKMQKFRMQGITTHLFTLLTVENI